MDNALLSDLNREFFASLLELKKAYPDTINRAFIKKHIEKASFVKQMDKMLKTRDYSCSAVFELCRDMLNELAGNDVPDNWLEYIYQYAIGKSFPQALETSLNNSLDGACSVYLQMLRKICNLQQSSDDGTWQSKYPLEPLSPGEQAELEDPDEYRLFLKAFDSEYIYEMMKLNGELMGHNTLDHICGVHYLSLFIARQFKELGLPTDLGRVSGAAAGHDIGKYGCRGAELKRVPYLHYYYTDQWFKKHGIVYIRNIAINHSTWDLEIENLSLESLILIYSDFRVKTSPCGKNKGRMHMFSLADSFDIVLGKLDNLDDKKEKRYRKVFAKLKDFEDYMVSLGIRTDPDTRADTPISLPKARGYYALMHGQQVVQNLKYQSIRHNINTMYRLRNEFSLNAILESARSEKNWKSLREYLRIFEDYSTYLTQKQKLITIKFLYEQLTHPEDDIRRHCSELIGTLIATFDEEYHKEVPPDAVLDTPDITSCQLLQRYLDAFIDPDHKIIPIHRSWIGYGLNVMVASLFAQCKPQTVNSYTEILCKYYSKYPATELQTQFYLLETLKSVPAACERKQLEIMTDFALERIFSADNSLRLSALDAVRSLILSLGTDCRQAQGLKELLTQNTSRSDLPAENYLKFKIAQLLRLGRPTIEKYNAYCREDLDSISDIFLSNLKTATGKIAKKIQVELLLEHTLSNDKNNAFYTAMHFCNLIKVSPVEDVRIGAGDALIRIIPHLNLEQRNDIAVELVRSLELEGHQFTKYIPYYLGQLILYLQPVELDEILDYLTEKTKQSGLGINSLILKTAGITLSYYLKYRQLFPQADEFYESRLAKMLGILLGGLVNYDQRIRQIAFSVIGKEIYGSEYLDMEQKNHIFRRTAKKILTLLPDNRDSELLLFINSSALNSIYKFISAYTFHYGSIDLKHPQKIAFFPGTFDPFSLGHKEIAKEIRRLGFEVFLAIDEFSWSKRTQPNLTRRNIINMSIADQPGIFLYPEDIPVNIAYPEDLRALRESFPNSEVYIVVGSDVILHASGYKDKKSPDSIHTFPHIVFDRRSALSSEEDDKKLDRKMGRIEGEIITLSLPPQYEDISSTQIRTYIDQNRDISMLVDPLAQKYIYMSGLYRREPQYKAPVSPVSIDMEIIENPRQELLEKLSAQMFADSKEAQKKLTAFSNKSSPRVLLLKEKNNGGRILGFSLFHWVRLSMLFKEFQNNMASEYIRDNTVGRIVVIDGIFTDQKCGHDNLEQIILTETLCYCLAKDYNYAVFRNTIEDYSSRAVEEVLELQGFEKLYFGNQHQPIYLVDMNVPCTLNLDVSTIIKESFRNNDNVKQAVCRSRKRLQRALSGLYPGKLLLSFDMGMLNQNLTKKICAENGVDTVPSVPRKLGSSVCVPFGTILNNQIVPNTVTKSLHTEKLFQPHMKSFRIGPFPYYLDLETQIKMLRSFNRQIILVDNLLHKGYRFKALDPLLKREGIRVKKFIVGILSGRGKELMDIQNRDVDSAYFVPRLRAWFYESALYPFLGGDTLWRGIYPQWNLIPSVNMILPYTSPTFINDVSNRSIFALSETCINNSIDIMTALEEEYQVMNERSLTLDLLGEVVNPPRCPDRGPNIRYDININPSHYLLNDLEALKRIEHTIIK
jgi:nicotinic acid mononucleotide adenylyltransferase